MIKDKIPKEEIEKWLEKLEEKISKIKMKDETKQQFLDNLKAYVNDCVYWLEKGDYVKAWEAISFAWGLYEAGEYFEVFEKIHK
ncbi:MAG: DUF357 domain-containing protein [Candidatus Aenigmarchaeota archaeon]|nr:DUF357 domain-containing protein [Candidatus Aenigmarchaeota archaeon]MCX8179597.1 DUF357 domain-containing protein [Candidatus Aenigmarchaeota archaeon]